MPHGVQGAARKRADGDSTVVQSYVEAMRVCLEEEGVDEDCSPAGLRLAKLVHEIVRALPLAYTRGLSE